MLTDKLLAKLWHSRSQLGGKVSLFDCMVQGELRTEIFGDLEECVDGWVAGAFVVAADAVDLVPHPAEIVVLRRIVSVVLGGLRESMKSDGLSIGGWVDASSKPVC
ncbi:hypothetical protein BOTNAR_0116g00110 [Botryotinia narcissicola]|uniref:Uncharacterized protein n=1 Tax=Botryotinia narcissicola TaxID=278944 RepID=A0A4Z1INT5_9HELO|nr:hypothetical protein BOTNAR_0116g00110 [Botryotinia narcissicola]